MTTGAHTRSVVNIVLPTPGNSLCSRSGHDAESREAKQRAGSLHVPALSSYSPLRYSSRRAGCHLAEGGRGWKPQLAQAQWAEQAL